MIASASISRRLRVCNYWSGCRPSEFIIAPRRNVGQRPASGQCEAFNKVGKPNARLCEPCRSRAGLFHHGDILLSDAIEVGHSIVDIPKSDRLFLCRLNDAIDLLVDRMNPATYQLKGMARFVDEQDTVIANSAVMKAVALGLCPDVSIDERQQLSELSEMQSEVLKSAASGKSNGDISVILNCSERAVKYHMSEILRKLGVATRAQAISRFAAKI
ncbi:MULTISPECIES: helix-turn-helix transcriptional regulator [Hyphomicrobiales]|uniref:helix-turn-helix transcriptional regulator n=1 Tax=Hyphomicrobiales TaxID=356 RepID=UPI0011BE44DE|nr:MULTISPECIES: helix-turn-helix transcriptional regulator [Hyphomicrobiales]